MAAPPETKPCFEEFKESVSEGDNPPPRNIRNQISLEELQKLGLTEHVLIARYPEVAQAAEQLNKRREDTSRTVKWITAVFTGLGAAVTLLMFKKSEGWGKWAKRGVTAILTGGGAGLASGMISSTALDKGDMKKYNEFQDIECAAIEGDIASARTKTLPTPLPDAQAPPTKVFSGAVTPRDTCYTAQAAKDAAAQPGTPAIGT